MHANFSLHNLMMTFMSHTLAPRELYRQWTAPKASNKVTPRHRGIRHAEQDGRHKLVFCHARMHGMLFVRRHLNERDECTSLLASKETEDVPMSVFILRHHFYCPHHIWQAYLCVVMFILTKTIIPFGDAEREVLIA